MPVERVDSTSPPAILRAHEEARRQGRVPRVLGRVVRVGAAVEEEHDCAVFDRGGRRARRHEASSDGYIVERDAGNGFMIQKLLAEVYESLRVGKGSGR